MMKSIQITAPGIVRIMDMELPVLHDDDVLLKIAYVGFCGSDLNTFLGRNPMVKMPVIPGHEVGAVIEAVGKNVPQKLYPGQIVTVNPYTACGYCRSCYNGRSNACRNNETLGVQRDGAMREYLVLPWQKIIPAETISVKHSALIEPMSVGFHAVARGQVSDNDIVMVVGCGMVGMGAVVRASLRGATIIAVDIDDEKLAIAREMGAHHTINSSTDDVHEQLEKLTQGHGPDVVIEAVGSAATYLMAVEEVAFTGRVVCIGYAKTDIAFQTKLFVQKELDIRGSRNALLEDFRGVIRYIEQGRCPVDKLITSIIVPDDVQNALQEWSEKPGRVFRILVEM